MKAEDNEVGGTGHPNKNGQRRIANELINYINKKGILAGQITNSEIMIFCSGMQKLR